MLIDETVRLPETNGGDPLRLAAGSPGGGSPHGDTWTPVQVSPENVRMDADTDVMGRVGSVYQLRPPIAAPAADSHLTDGASEARLHSRFTPVTPSLNPPFERVRTLTAAEAIATLREVRASRLWHLDAPYNVAPPRVVWRAGVAS